MWVKTKQGSFANIDYVSYLHLNSDKEWIICENGDGFSQLVDNETAERLIEYISKNLL